MTDNIIEQAEPEIDSYWSEREPTPQEQAPGLTPDAAQQQIDAKMLGNWG